MQLSFSLVVTLLVCAEGVVSAASNFSLFAYGHELPTGMKLFHAGGEAYLGHKAPPFAADAVNITLTLTEDRKFLASPDDNKAAWASQPCMYIGTDAGDLKKVGFVAEDSVPEGAIFKGFGLFGGWAYNNQKSGEIEMNFVAMPANETGLYEIMWNAASFKSDGDHVPISLRTSAPATPSN